MSAEDRVILHCDCNSFFASVETKNHPEYLDVPMAVCGNTEDRHGIVLAKNELAKKFGIQTAETVFSAKRKCPSLVIAEPHPQEYVKTSKAVSAIYARYTDMIEPFGLDECWLDVTASRKLFGTGREIADRIRKEVRDEIGITLSVGVSFNKVFAKFGSDYKKPDATTEITRDNYKDIVWNSPVGSILFVGKKTEIALSGMGIRTVGDLARTDVSVLDARFGKAGELLHAYAAGEDESPVALSEEDAKSVSNGMTFRRDLTAFSDCRAGISYLSEEIGTRLRHDGMVATTVALTVKDPLLHSFIRQRPLKSATDLSIEIASAAYRILIEEWTEGKPIRMLTVSAMNLCPKHQNTEQISFFPESGRREKKEKSEQMLDAIRKKYGSSSIVRACAIGTDIGIYDEKEKK